ncbi:mas-related G-protein coupled receptor member A6-like [Micropterus dolomieu]|uniref:mas-related G-protein coupled receptor member A6-like n=1 Tax=Micropterus dolomieu TaxID=147949 RepID=UPI001E8EBB2C|nr:mas-related G-protein coupled receptor member A6-like [Micropterus dolomieu]
MEGLYINSSSQDQTYDYSNTTSNYQKNSNTTSNYQKNSSTTSNYQKNISTTSNYQNFSSITSNYQNFSSTTPDYPDYNEFYEYFKKLDLITHVVIHIIIAVGLPLTLVAIYALYSMVRRDHVAPIYVINLLITDVLQFCCMIIRVAPNGKISEIFYSIYLSALLASVYFMVCISLERYLVIAHPLWYRCRRTIKTSVVVCVVLWVLTGVCGVLLFFSVCVFILIIFPILLLLPFPLLIFSLVGTLKALSASISVPSDEKRRIVGILVLVLLIYTLLFLPDIIWFLIVSYINNDVTLNLLSFIFVRLSPLADLFLYVFMRKGFIDKLLASVCCCRMESNDISSPSV